jgi:hypothetical protein
MRNSGAGLAFVTKREPQKEATQYHLFRSGGASATLGHLSDDDCDVDARVCG